MSEERLRDNLSPKGLWDSLRNKSMDITFINEQKVVIKVENEQLTDVLEFLKELEAVLFTLAGTDQRAMNQGYGVYPVFLLPNEKIIVELALRLDSERPEYPSVTNLFPAAHWLEREIRDLLGINPQGHPDLRRLAVHPDWPSDIFPLRKDFISGTKVSRVEGEIEFCQVEGEGLYQIPVGPVHAGIIEPGHFRFFAFGEEVVNLQAQLFYTHRGVEKSAEGKNFQDVALLAERICGACAVSHAAAYAQAVEGIAGVEIPLRAKYVRTILMEMERLYNHIGDLGNMCAGVGFTPGISRGGILKEKIMRKNMELAGHRYLRGMIVPGGVRHDLNIIDMDSWLEDVEAELKDLNEIILSSSGLLDRMQTTGVLTYVDALTLGAVGPAARASGVNRDLRRDLPYAAYDLLDFQVPTHRKGDVYRRLIQRMEEAGESLTILRQALLSLKPGELCLEIRALPAYKTGIGWTESARGANVHWIMSGENNTIDRYVVRSASHCNWPVLPLCMPGNIVPDFPLINKSFELCYACLDR